MDDPLAMYGGAHVWRALAEKVQQEREAKEIKESIAENSPTQNVTVEVVEVTPQPSEQAENTDSNAKPRRRRRTSSGSQEAPSADTQEVQETSDDNADAQQDVAQGATDGQQASDSQPPAQ